MNYTWYILNLGLKDQMNQEGVVLEDAIVYVHWKKVAEDSDGNFASYVGKTELLAEEISSDSFINLNAVTKENVVSWIENSMSVNKVNSIDNILAKKIEKSKIKSYRPNWD